MAKKKENPFQKGKAKGKKAPGGGAVVPPMADKKKKIKKAC